MSVDGVNPGFVKSTTRIRIFIIVVRGFEDYSSRCSHT